MIAEDVIKSAGILLKEHGWCQRYFCVNSETQVPVLMGQDLGKTSGYHHCILGALRQYAFDQPESNSYNAYIDVMEKIALAIDPANEGVCISAWNDEPGRTVEEVLAVLRKAMQPL